jgi:hypothetical protein
LCTIGHRLLRKTVVAIVLKVKGGHCHHTGSAGVHNILIIINANICLDDRSFGKIEHFMINFHSESAFQKAIEAAEQLSVDQRLELLNVLRQRIQQTKHQNLVSEVKAVREEYRSGNVQFGSVSDFMSELDEP